MKQKSGFTVIEMMVIVAILAILSAISVPNLISWRTNHQLNSQVREMQAVLQELRLQAIKANSPATITFNSRSYTITKINRSNPALNRTTTKELQPGVTVAADFGGGNTLTFNNRGMPPTGSINNGDGVTFKNQKGNTRSILVNIVGNTRIM